MKKTIAKLFTLTAIIAVFLLPSCQKLPYLSAKVGNNNFKALYILSVYGKYDSTHNGFLILAGESANLDSGSYIVLLVKGDKAGEYDLDLTLDSANIVTNSAAFYLPHGNQDSTNSLYAGIKGYIKLTQVDLTNNRLQGTFQFTLRNKNNDQVEITNGQFDNLIFINSDKLSSIFNYNR